MRRTALVAIAASFMIAMPAIPGFADPSPAASVVVPSATPGQTVCSVDAALNGLTGLVTTTNGYAVINGAMSTDVMRVYLLDNACKRKTSLAYPPAPLDPEDLQIDAQGNYWVSDSGLGGNGAGRGRIAVWKLSADGKNTIYRFTFPDGKVTEIDAMVLGGNGLPVFITKNANGAASVYTPNGALDAATNNRTVPLKLVGQFTPQHTGTANKLGRAGELPVTGGATSPDGTKVALRTFSDAYEWDVTNGDVAGAITTGTPRITPLPMEDQGTAIAYSRDGKTFVTLASPAGTTARATLLKYTPSLPVSPTKAAGAGGTPKADTRGWFSRLTLQQLTYLVGGVGLIGLLMVIGGIVGIRRSRKRRPPATPVPADLDEPWDNDPDAGAGMRVPSGSGYDDGYQDDRYPPAAPDPYQQPRYPRSGGNTYGAGSGGGTYGRPARPQEEYEPGYQQPGRGYQTAAPPRGAYPPSPPRGYAPPPAGAPRGEPASGRARRPEPQPGWGGQDQHPDDYRDYRDRR